MIFIKKYKLQFILTTELAATKPKNCKIINDYGHIDYYYDEKTIISGNEVIIEATENAFYKWLSKEDEFFLGQGLYCTPYVNWSCIKSEEFKRIYKQLGIKNFVNIYH